MGRITPDQFSASQNDKPHFDSNCITPGTDFMDLVAKALQYYAVDRMTRDPGWRNVQVILSDASVPGEGEHKIMELIRYQRSLDTYNPNTRHVIYGLDADLIMLGLATHEPHFSILREYVSPDGKRSTGAVPSDQVVPVPGPDGSPIVPNSANQNPHQSAPPPPPRQAPFQFLRLHVLREYLGAELFVENLPFKWDLERALDDYVFLCFFVGNDFLPHMPTLEIREGAIDLLTELWKKSLPQMGGFITHDGEVDFSRAEAVLSELGDLENEILSRRRQREQRSRERQLEQVARDRRLESEALLERQERQRSREIPAAPLSEPTPSVSDNKAAAALLRQQLLQTPADGSSATLKTEEVVQVKRARSEDPSDNLEPAAKRTKVDDVETETTRSELTATAEMERVSSFPSIDSVEDLDESTGIKKKKRTIAIEDEDVRAAKPVAAADEDADTVKLGEDGWKERYYLSKFGAKIENPDDASFFRRLISAYIHGLQWVLRYYYQGCCSWTWYYPFHYAPFAGELKDLGSLEIVFEKGVPFAPFEQLMGVLPAASGQSLPEPYRALMSDPLSPIIEFYPEDFDIDLNGKRFEWQGVALLPFIDQDKLLSAIKPVEEKLSPLEKLRNSTGVDLYFVRWDHPAAQAIKEGLELAEAGQPLNSIRVPLSPALSDSFAGDVSPWQFAIENLQLDLPYVPRQYPGSSPSDPMAIFPSVPKNKTIAAKYYLPTLAPGTRFKARLLPNVSMPLPELNSWDLNRRRHFNHFGNNTPGSRILDHVLQSTRGRGGGRGGFNDRGRGGYQDRGRGGYQERGRGGDRGRGGYQDRGRGGYGRDNYSDRGNYNGPDGGGYSGRGRGGDNYYRGGTHNDDRYSNGGRYQREESRYRPEPYAMNMRGHDDRSYREGDRREEPRREESRYRDYGQPNSSYRGNNDYNDRGRYDGRRYEDDRRNNDNRRYDGPYDNRSSNYRPREEPAYAGNTRYDRAPQPEPQLQYPPQPLSYGQPQMAMLPPLSQLPPAIAAALLLANPALQGLAAQAPPGYPQNQPQWRPQ
jgi:5'-3' exoribonuclease 2